MNPRSGPPRVLSFGLARCKKAPGNASHLSSARLDSTLLDFTSLHLEIGDRRLKKLLRCASELGQLAAQMSALYPPVYPPISSLSAPVERIGVKLDGPRVSSWTVAKILTSPKKGRKLEIHRKMAKLASDATLEPNKHNPNQAGQTFQSKLSFTFLAPQCASAQSASSCGYNTMASSWFFPLILPSIQLLTLLTTNTWFQKRKAKNQCQCLFCSLSLSSFSMDVVFLNELTCSSIFSYDSNTNSSFLANTMLAFHL